MSALDFGGGAVGANPGRYFTFTSPALPDADWCIGIWHRRLSVAGSSEQGLWSIGTPETTDSMYLYTGEASWANGALGGRGVNSAGTDWYNTSPGVTLPQNGLDYLVIAQRRSSVVEWYITREGTAAAAYFTSAAVSGTLSSGAGIVGIGAGSDDNRSPLGEFFILTSDSLSAAEVTTLASGRHIDALRPNRLVDLRFRDGAQATEKNRGTGGATYDATAVSSGFTTATEFFPEGNPETIHRQARRPRPRRMVDYGLNLNGEFNSVKWVDSLLEVASGGGGTVGLASETDSAFALARVQIKPTGLATEADTAAALTVTVARAAGLSTEADTAFALARVQIKTVGLATEADSAFALAGVQLRSVGLATETDTAFAPAVVQLRAVGRADEADTALALAPSAGANVGVAVETDIALALAAVQIAAVGLASETDSGLSLGSMSILATGLASEADSAIARPAVLQRPVGLASESDTAFALAAVQKLLAGAAYEADTAFALAPFTAGGLSPQHRAWLLALARVHGLIDPLVVTATGRTDGVIVQALSVAAGVTTVTPVSIPSGSPGTSPLATDEAALLEALCRAHGLIDPLQVSATGRTDGTLTQTTVDNGTAITLTRV